MNTRYLWLGSTDSFCNRVCLSKDHFIFNLESIHHSIQCIRWNHSSKQKFYFFWHWVSPKIISLKLGNLQGLDRILMTANRAFYLEIWRTKGNHEMPDLECQWVIIIILVPWRLKTVFIVSIKYCHGEKYSHF